MTETYALELRLCLADCFEDITLSQWLTNTLVNRAAICQTLPYPISFQPPTIQQILIDLQFCVSIAFGAKETTVKN